MRTERTRHYYEACNGYRQSLRGIWAAFDKEMQRLEQYKGSTGYEKEKADAERKRDDDIKALQSEYREKFSGILKGMRESATTRAMIAPTQEQLALLQALKMREKIGRDELEQAGRTLKDSPVCLSVLDEIARDMGKKTNSPAYYGLRFSTESTSGILSCIDSLTESAKRICSLNKCDSKAEQAERASIYSTEHTHNALYSFRTDRDVSSVREAMETFGGVQSLDSFEAAVNE